MAKHWKATCPRCGKVAMTGKDGARCKCGHLNILADGTAMQLHPTKQAWEGAPGIVVEAVTDGKDKAAK